MFTEEYHMCYLINIIRKQLPFFWRMVVMIVGSIIYSPIVSQT